MGDFTHEPPEESSQSRYKDDFSSPEGQKAWAKVQEELAQERTDSLNAEADRLIRAAEREAAVEREAERRGRYQRDIDRHTLYDPDDLVPSLVDGPGPMLQPRWLWSLTPGKGGLIPLGELFLITGPKGVGKSTLLCWLAAQVTKGKLPGEYWGNPQRVIFLSREDRTNETLRPRFVAQGGDLDFIKWQNPDTTGFNSLELIAWGPALVLVDPVSAYIESPPNNEHGEIAVRHEFEVFRQLAQGNGISTAAVRHWHKGSSKSTDAYDMVLGSRAWTDLARATLFIVPDRSRTDQSTTAGFFYGLTNAGPRQPGIAYHIASKDFTYDDGEGTVAYTHWDEDVICPATVEDALKKLSPDPKESSTPAKDKFLAWLDDHSGETFITLDAIAADAGVSVKKAAEGLKSAGITKGDNGQYTL